MSLPTRAAAGDDVRQIATIRNKDVFVRWGESVEPSVVLSEERIGHIMERHPGAFERYGAYATDAIEAPDYILEDVKNADTAAFIRHVENTNINVVVKLAIKGNDAGMKSSVITLYPMNDKRLRRMMKKAIVLYKRGDICYNINGSEVEI